MSARRRDRKAARQLVAAQHRALVSAGVRTIVTCDCSPGRRGTGRRHAVTWTGCGR